MRTSLSSVFLLLLLGAGAAVYILVREAEPIPVEAKAPAQGTIPSNPTGGPLWDSAEAYWRSGALADAQRLFSLGETRHPRDAAWPQALAECLAAQGLHEEAIAALERCRSIAPLSPEAAFRQRRSRLEVGFAKAGNGDPWTARQLADVVLEQDPDDSLAMLLQGYSWAMEGALPRAEDVLTKLVTRHPGQVDAYPLLIQCAFRRGDADAADRWIQAFSNLVPSDALLDLWRDQARALRSGRGAFSSRLRVICDGSCPLGTEQEVLGAAERAWSALAHDLGRAPPDPVSIRIVHRGSMPTDWAEAIFDGQVRLPMSIAASPDTRDKVLRHELAHAFLVDFSGGRIPLWLNEGLAQWLEGRRPASLPDARSATWLDELPGRTNFMDLSGEEAGLAYSYSLAVTGELMLLHGSVALLRYLDLLAGGASEDICFHQAFGRTYADLSTRVRAKM